jgi:hypothetical protein
MPAVLVFLRNTTMHLSPATAQGACCCLVLFAGPVPAGVLKYKHDSELALMASGLPYTILRPSRLTDGPYTSFDLNTLLQATAGSRQDVQLAPSDTLLGEASRIAVAGERGGGPGWHLAGSSVLDGSRCWLLIGKGLLTATHARHVPCQAAAASCLWGRLTEDAAAVLPYWLLHAEACVQALGLACAENQAYALASTEGQGPGQDKAMWQQLFEACNPPSKAKKPVAV